MAQVIWVEPALQDLDEIADHIALDNPAAARELVRRVFQHVDKVERFPRMGSRLPELPRSRYRQVVEPPCRVIYRFDGRRVYVLHIVRGERLLRSEEEVDSVH